MKVENIIEGKKLSNFYMNSQGKHYVVANDLIIYLLAL
jgi:hypothetical protein